jgi:hypothetical protein
VGLTIACVYNDIEVRGHCLDRSLEAYEGELPVQYLPVDNTEHAFSSAGAALNHATRQAVHDVVVFVHQDVHLHDVEQLQRAADALEDPRWGVLGANGVTAQHEWAGRLRDRVVLVGAPAARPVAVDTLDEVLFMARREDLLAEPLSEHPDLAWHAYAVEYALRVRASGRLAGAVDTAITHNSMSTNLARLSDAHRHVGDLHPELLPIRTTCGTVGPPRTRLRDLPVVRDHRWRLRWLRQSRVAAQVRGALGVPVVLADLAHEVDLLEWSGDDPLHVVNLDRTGTFCEVAGAPVTLERAGRPIVMSSVASLAALADALDCLEPSTRVVITDLTVADLPHLGARVRRGQWLAGVHEDAVWLASGPVASEVPAQWRDRRAVPLGA